MARYLLGTQALVDLARRERSSPVYSWVVAEKLSLDSAFVSVMSFEQFRSAVDEREGVQHSVWAELFHQALRAFSAARTLLPVTIDVALRSAALNALELHATDPEDGTLYELDPREQLVAATALVEDLPLVDRIQPYHATLAPLGLSVIDPFGAASP